MEGNERTKREATDSSFPQNRKTNETEWIKTPSTGYSCGMNDKVGDETTTNNDELIDSKPPSLKRILSYIWK